jgi:DNA-binding PucR family transcriptional regulator
VAQRTAEAHLARAERLQNATGALATAAMAAMETNLPWFGKLSAQDRSWIGLVAQSGITAFVEWFRDPDAHSSMPTRIFGSAPREFTRVISLHQTVDLVRTTIETIEDTVGDLLPAEDVPMVHGAIQRYAREVAFAAATVYAQAAEMRGAWDARLEALVVDSVIRGEADESVRSRASALGWSGAAGTTGSAEVAVVVGRAPEGTANVADAVRHAAREAGADALCAMQGDRLVVVLGGTSKPVEIVQKLAHFFGPGPIVVGPIVKDLMAAVTSARAAVAGLRAAPAWPGAPRPVQADELLPERSLSGDGHARRQLATDVYGPLTVGDGVLLDTVSAYLDSGGSIEATARAMFIHANTVRYRLKRVGDITGYNPLNPRDAFTLRVALALGRLLNPEPGSYVL